MTLDVQYEHAVQADTDIKDHLPMLKELASKCDHVTEFGVRYGTSTLALLAGRPKALISYDTFVLFNVKQFEEWAKEAGVEFMFCHANVLLSRIEPTDFLFIDTYHSYGQLIAELARHADSVRRFIAMHDTVSYGRHGMDGKLVGLMDAWDEFAKIHPEWKQIYHSDLSHGFTVFERTPTSTT
jgi:hypothetical protein